MLPKLFFGFLITVVAICVFLLLLVIVGGIIAGLLAPFLGNVPVSYNFRSIRARWTSTIVAVLGIAGTVGVFVAMLSLARGFKATLVASGSPDNALVMRAGSPSEMMGGVTLESIKVIQDAPGIARGANGPLVTQEVVGVMPIPLISTGTDANVQIRGVSPNVLEITQIRENRARTHVQPRRLRNRCRQKRLQNLFRSYGRQQNRHGRWPLGSGRSLRCRWVFF